MGRLVKVFSSSVGVEAQLAWAALDAAGIPGHVQGADLIPGAFGADAHHAAVYVPEASAADAHAVLGTALKRDAAGALSLTDSAAASGRLSIAETTEETEPDPCAACGAEWEPGFEVCWRCEKPRAG